MEVNQMKYILKKIFPLVYLRKIQYVFNQILLKIYYPMIFSRYTVTQTETLKEEKKNPFLELIDINKFTEKELKDFRLWVNPSWKQDQYIVNIKQPHKIDPKLGWAIIHNRKLIYPSLGFSHVFYLQRPSLTRRESKYKKLRVNEVVSFRDTGEQNYFHFFNDVIAKFYYLENQKLLNNNQGFVISEALYKKEYFQYFIHNSRLGKYNWIIQDKRTIIESNNSLFCKPYTHSKNIYLEILKDLKIKKSNLTQNKRVYLSRSENSLRYISNEREIITLLIQYGFEIIDSSKLKFEDQIELFSRTEILIGVHGAGLTNMMYRNGGKMKILEIFSPYLPYNPFHYIMMSKMFDFSYQYITGIPSKYKFKGGFTLSREELFNKLNQLID
jgi:Glycosyltransferase 61